MIDKVPPSGGTVDIMDLYYRMTIDVTTDFLLGHSVNSLEYPQAEFVKAFNEVQRFQMLVTVLVYVHARLFPRRLQTSDTDIFCVAHSRRLSHGGNICVASA